MEPIELWHHIAPTLAATGRVVFITILWLAPVVLIPLGFMEGFRLFCEPAPISDREAGLPRSVLDR